MRGAQRQAERALRYREFVDLMKREPGNRRTRARYNEPDGVLRCNCTWFDCIDFCNRLSEREGLVPAYSVVGLKATLNPRATGYRLPTKAEWEFACRAGTTSLWYFGMTAQQAQVRYVRNFVQAEDEFRGRTGVANAFGLTAMYGGSAERCWDRYDPVYYQECARRGVTVDPQGPNAGERRVGRGGSDFGDGGGDMSTLNTAARLLIHPVTPFAMQGYGRLVLPVTAMGHARPVAGVRSE
jgi:formylglycine-generating enzyme required for sulfatase activity